MHIQIQKIRTESPCSLQVLRLDSSAHFKWKGYRGKGIYFGAQEPWIEIQLQWGLAVRT